MKIQPLQDKALWGINFEADHYGVRDLHKNDQIPQISDYIKMFICKRCSKKFADFWKEMLIFAKNCWH